jgi:nicotinamidase-related amidase
MVINRRQAAEALVIRLMSASIAATAVITAVRAAINPRMAVDVSGSETDVCVLATVLDAVDIGYRVIVVRDAICSSSDEGHDMLMRLYHTLYTEQIETASFSRSV